MSYITGQRVQSHDGKRRGTVTRNANDHSSVRVIWDGDDAPLWELPESVTLQAQQPGQSARDAWQNGDARLKKGITR